MTAVCNDGKIYMIRKEENYSPQALKDYYEEGVKISEEKCKSEQLKKAKKSGIDILDPQNTELINNIPTKPYFYGMHNVAKHAQMIGITFRCSVPRRGGR